MEPSLWLLGLGALHGINPGMGWLFAVALGLQERRARAVWQALLPLAIGHALAIVAAILLLTIAGLVAPAGALKWIVAASLAALGIRRLVRHRHPRWGGMQVSRRDLVVWSFLMASAHGAGLMVLPVLLAGDPARAETVHAHSIQEHGDHLGASAAGRISGVAAALVHTCGYLAVTGLVAALVYGWAGLRLLRSAWINLDLIWVFAILATALVTPLF